MKGVFLVGEMTIPYIYRSHVQIMKLLMIIIKEIICLYSIRIISKIRF